MAGSPRQKKVLGLKMANYFAENGYLDTLQEFNQDSSRPELVTISTIKRIFGAWSLMIKFITQFPGTAEIVKGLPETKPIAADPLVELQAKTAKEAEEGDDGENI